MEDEIFQRILQNISHTTTAINSTAHTNEQFNYLGLILQLVTFAVVGGFGLMMKLLWTRLKDSLFSKKIVIPEKQEGAVTLPSKVVDADHIPLAEQIGMKVQAVLNQELGGINEKLNAAEKTNVKQEECIHRIEGKIDNTARKTEEIGQDMQKLHVSFAEHLGFSKAKDVEVDKRLDRLNGKYS